MKGSAAVIALVVIVLLVACGMLAFIFIKPQSSASNTTVSSSVESSAGQPSIPVKDFAPNLPMTQKTTVIIMSNDSSEEKYIVPANQVDTYIKQLPPGYHVVSKNP